MATSTTKAQDVILCHLCDKRPALLHCNPCQVNLCEECVGKHYMTSTSSTHEIVKYGDRKFHLSFSNCKVHSGEKCTVKCQNCDVEVCLKCLSGAHNGHRIIEMKDIVDEKKKLVEKDTAYLKDDIIPKFGKADTEIESKLATLNAKCDELEQSVTEHGQKWQRFIEEIVAKNKKDIAEMRENGIRKLKEYQKEIKNGLAGLHEISLQNKKISQSVNVSYITKYESNIQKFQKIPLHIELDLPTFVSKDIDRGKLYQDFGKLKEPKIQTEPIFRSNVSNELLDMAIEITSFSTGMMKLMRMACVNTEEVWITGRNKTITRFNIQGSVQKTVTSTCPNYPGDISISKEGHLLYTDAVNQVINDVHQTTAHITAPQGWKPVGLCCTQSGDLLVSMCTSNYKHYKIVRYEGQTIKQEIEKDDQGKPLYKGGENMLFVTENNNGDICTSDCNARDVVVMNKVGRLRFRYKGQQTMEEQFDPTSIVTDSAGCIIIKDNGNSCTHIIDQDGQFLHSLDFCGALSVDSLGRLWVGEYESGNVKIVKYTK
ncbi:E3 ubiquitin-protein ligase TRIM71-like [Saccostrea echinata]|uniref:E3 ubiquitin-protein ligase TRIM71-like n=1 Tax=Saccostrea echinata TaxID=191078 RepID=UPI002A806E5D|nr:E3 ubiquitin-protein ligase TRIM71-like [Saccostrea echinata]